MRRVKFCVRAALAAMLLAAVMLAPSPPAFALSGAAVEFASTLDPRARQSFEEWQAAQADHETVLDFYWRDVTDKRAQRRAKRAKSEVLTLQDYVLSFPPEYKGPKLPPEIAKAWADFQTKSAIPVEPPRPIPTVAEAVAGAKLTYGFEPRRVSEREFKLAYAREALALGLSKEQVVRIYALETGGIGTADMQAGIHPIKKTGTPISSALGYAQLLNANSVEETAKHGAGFLDRLKRMAQQPGLDPARAKALNAKHAALRRMVINARSVRHSWDAHVAYAGTPKGLGIHALNLDGDIGPWIQVVKLKGLKELADKSGRTKLAGNEIELMNLAGPGTGLEMMDGAGRIVPTPNFFSRAAYSRNSIVRGKTSEELLAALDKRMDENIKNPGAVEFAAVFDEIAKERSAER